MSPACRSWGKTRRSSGLVSSVFVSRLCCLRHRQRACKPRGPLPPPRALPTCPSNGVDGSSDESAGDLCLVGRSGKRRGFVETGGRVECPGNRSYSGEGDSNLAVEARSGNSDDRKRPLPSVHRLEIGG